MKLSDLVKISFVVLCLCFSSVSQAEGERLHNKTQLFQKLSNAGIDQVVELPYNSSLLGAMAGQVKVHNIIEMQDSPIHLPEPTSLPQEYNSSHEHYSQRQVLPQLSYRTGKGTCAYKEAVKVNDVLVCYKSARYNHTRISGMGHCSTAAEDLSHCFIFAHNVDDVVRAISSGN